MSTDKNKAKPPPVTVPDDLDDDGDDDFKSAADDPTAVWDEDSMKNAGLTELIAARRSQIEASKPAATPPEPARTRRPSVEIDDDDEPRSGERPGGRARALVDLTDPGVAPSPAGARRGLSWPVTIALAVALGAVVYLLVRLVKG